MAIRIEPELQTLIPPLSADEYTQLERNVVKEGIRDPLVVWTQADGNSVLIDGHNRFAIAESHPGMKYETKPIVFKDMEEAKLWIINNQLGRRNLPKFDRVTLEDKKREILARQAKKNIGGDHKSEEYQKSLQRNLCSDSDKTGNQARRERTTDYKIAKAANTSEDTVRKVRAINEKATDQTKQLVREGKLSINQAYNSVMPKREDPVKQAVKQAVKEHEEFKQEKKESVVDFKSVQTDKANQEIINTALLESVLKLLNDIDKFGFAHKTDELSGLYKVIKDDERELIAKRCQTCRMILQTIEEHIWRPYPGGS